LQGNIVQASVNDAKLILVYSARLENTSNNACFSSSFDFWGV